MKKTQSKILAFNWKMNPETVIEAKKIFNSLKKISSQTKKVDLLIFPPSLYISELKKNYKGKKVSFGSQTSYPLKSGSVTGEVSFLMNKNMGIDYSLVGHSERRLSLSENGSLIPERVSALLENKMTPILCFGETTRDGSGDYIDFLKKQLKNDLKLVKEKDLKNLILAYEPIWAIGAKAKRAVTEEELFSTIILIKKILFKMYGKKSEKIKILYGGSVSEENIQALLNVKGVGGFLVGRASLDPKKFTKMVEVVEKMK
jgi:triosephosphate isomerase